MTIRYDYQIFCKQQFGGISRYYYELIKGLEASAETTIQLDLLFADNRYFQTLRGNNSAWSKLHFKGKKDFTYLFAKFYDACQLKHKTFDIFHPTYYNRSSLERTKGKPMVVTIHDLIDEKFFIENDGLHDRLEARKAHIEKAAKIIAVSESTKKDLIDFYHVAPEKIQVIYHGNSFTRSLPRFSLEAKLPSPYLFYLGRRDGYKNFIPFIKAVKSCLLNDHSLSMVCAGGGDFTKEELTVFDELGISKQVKLVPILSDMELASFYNNAELFIYPSLYEGFGLPIIEAFQCGCPVITSNCSSMIEIGANAATYFDPKDEISILQTVQQMLYNKPDQQKMVDMGYSRAQDFNWPSTVNKTLQLYHSI